MSDFFLSKSATSKKTSEDMLDDPFLVKGTDHVYFLTTEVISLSHVSFLKSFIRNTLGFEGPDFSIVFSLKFVPSDKDLSKNQEEFFLTNTINLSNIIPPGSKIITFGKALTSVTFNSDMDVPSFYDTVWNKTYFFDPRSKSWVFPVDSFYEMFNRDTRSFFDNYTKIFFQYQLRKVSSFQPPALRWPEPILVDVRDTEAFFEEHKNETKVSWDTETSGFNYMSDQIRCITMSFDGITGYYLRWKDVNLESLNAFFQNKKQIGANLKFDLRFGRHRGLTNCSVYFDTFHAGHCLNEMRSNSLKTHSWLYTSVGGYEDSLKRYKKRYPKMNYYQFPDSILIPYATMDAIVAYRVYMEMSIQLDRDPLLKRYYFEDVMPSVLDYLDFEMEGMCIDWERVREVGVLLDNEIAEVVKKLHDTYGYFNLESGDAVGDFFEFTLKLPCLGRSKTGHYLTNKKLLNEWKKQGRKELDLFLEYSELAALKQTFVGDESRNSGLWKYRYPDGKLHGTFWVMLAKSGRNRSSDPNLQNIPKKGKKAILIRSMFRTPDDQVYSTAETDSAGLQLRIGASLSGDPVMSRIFIHEDGDLHSQTAYDTFVQSDDFKIRVTDEDGTVRELFNHEKITIMRNNVKTSIEAGELLETDSFNVPEDK